MMSGTRPAVCRWRGSRTFQLGGRRADEEQEGAEQRHVFEKHDPAERRRYILPNKKIKHSGRARPNGSQKLGLLLHF